MDYLKSMQRYQAEDIHDNELKKLRVEAGMSQEELGEKIGIDKNRVCQIELGMVPVTIDGKWKPWVEKLSQVFSLLPEDIFPREVCKIDRKSMEEEDFLPLGDFRNASKDHDYEKQFDLKWMWENIKSILRDNEFEVLFLRFAHEMTLAKIAERRGCTQERVRQIQAKGMRRLRGEKSIFGYSLIA